MYHFHDIQSRFLFTKINISYLGLGLQNGKTISDLNYLNFTSNFVTRTEMQNAIALQANISALNLAAVVFVIFFYFFMVVLTSIKKTIGYLLKL